MSEGRESIDLLALALAYHRAPLDHQDRLAAVATLPEDMNRLLWLANGSEEILAAAARQVGAEAGEVREAALFLLQRLCLARDAGHYRVLGLNPDATAEQIKDHHRLLMRLVHPDRVGAADLWVDSYAARINEAYSVLSRPQTRAAYDGSRARGEPSATMVPVVARSRSTAWREAPRRRRSRLALRAHLPVLVLGGLALVAVLGVAGFSLRPSPAIMGPAESVATAGERSSMTMLTGGDALAAFQAKPNWRPLDPVEREAVPQEPQVRPERAPSESTHQERLRIERAELERLRGERTLLEQQMRAERLEVERRRLEQLRAEQAQVERLRAERANAERLKLEQLRAEQAQAGKLAEQARAERLKLEQLRAEQAQAGKLAEQARAERLKLEQLRAERQTAARDLTARELDHLIGRYTSAYQSGDLDRLMALFDARARGGGGQDRDRLRRDYAKFFDATQSRRLRLTPVRWSPRGTTATGVTQYRLRAVQSDGSTRDYEGGIRFEVSRQDARVVIQSIDFDIRRLQ
jgi:curved DNA-binding protein CbpA